MRLALSKPSRNEPPTARPQSPRSGSLSRAPLALFSPANCAWRAFGAARRSRRGRTSDGADKPPQSLASGLRSLFSRWESILLLDSLYPDDEDPILAEGAAVLRRRQPAGGPRRISVPPSAGRGQPAFSTTTASRPSPLRRPRHFPYVPPGIRVLIPRTPTPPSRSRRGSPSGYGAGRHDRDPMPGRPRFEAPSTVRSGRSCCVHQRRTGGHRLPPWCHIWSTGTPRQPGGLRTTRRAVDRYRVMRSAKTSSPSWDRRSCDRPTTPTRGRWPTSWPARGMTGRMG